MKGFLFDVVGSALALIGSIIGAGFITGAEIVAFFSGTNMLLSCAALGVFCFAFMLVLLRAGERWGNVKEANLCVLGGFCKIADGALYVFSFVTVCGMCAGLDAAAAGRLGVSDKLPLLSPPLLALSLAVCKRGVGGLKAVSIVLVPAILAVLAVACLSGRGEVKTDGDAGLLRVACYVGMNAFLCAPVAVGVGQRLRAGRAVAVAATVSAVISALVLIIMRKISSGYGTDENLPLVSCLGLGGVFSAVFFLITVFGICTTLISAHYPLVQVIGKSPLKRTLNACLCIGALALSRIGFYNIVSCVYPVIGVFGVAYVLALAVKQASIAVRAKPLRKAYERVHARGEKAQHQR